MIAAAVLAAVYVTFLIVRPDSDNNRECVNTASMKVAAAAHCQTSGGTGIYRWYWGARAQVGDQAHGGSFRNPNKKVRHLCARLIFCS